ncbi:hypothetical protein B566_EDAN012797 [Ephemera danica]|nr:hypothetical protein B566_EDAN012797 [Ephemera danica]
MLWRRVVGMTCSCRCVQRRGLFAPRESCLGLHSKQQLFDTMPRAFLITHRRYNVEQHPHHRESSPERGVSLAECTLNHAAEVNPPVPPAPASTPTTSASPTPPVPSSPPCRPPPAEDLYNLTQLAEVSLFHPELHGCPECGKRYSTSSNLARHRQTHRSLADKKARRCPHCDKVYVSMPAFSMHVRTHNQGCKCPYCGKCFSRPWLLQGHIRTHTGEKPFRCNICNKAFADKSNLRAHVQTHSNTKPFVCGRCGKAFALKSYLYKHEESSCMRLHPRSGSSESSSGSSSPVPDHQEPGSTSAVRRPYTPPGTAPASTHMGLLTLGTPRALMV